MKTEIWNCEHCCDHESRRYYTLNMTKGNFAQKAITRIGLNMIGFHCWATKRKWKYSPSSGTCGSRNWICVHSFDASVKRILVLYFVNMACIVFVSKLYVRQTVVITISCSCKFDLKCFLISSFHYFSNLKYIMSFFMNWILTF